MADTEPPARVTEEIRRAMLSGRHHFDRAMRAPVGSNEREKLLAHARTKVEAARELADAHGVPPQEFPQWSYALIYGREEAEAQALRYAQAQNGHV
jgi:hypothetical protein